MAASTARSSGDAGRDPSRPLPLSAFAVLGLLALGDEHTAYEVKQRADRMIAPVFLSPAMSAVYSELDRLDRLGLVSHRLVAESEIRSKRLYRITLAGRQRLARWVSDGAPEPTVVKSATMLRVAFGHVADPGTLLHHVRCHADWAEAEAERLRTAVSEQAGDGFCEGYGGEIACLVLEWAADRVEAEAEASRRLAGRLARLEPAGAAPSTAQE